jgi:hypothetical protein
MNIKTRNGRDSQEWYFDWKTKTIRNMNSSRRYKMQVQGGYRMQATTGNQDNRSEFKFDGTYFTCVSDNATYNGRTLMIKNQDDKENSTIELAPR